MSKLPHTYPVMEHFYTIQGEGAHTGKAAYFIRLAGCDVGCPWCDVKESWQEEGHPILTIQTLVDAVVDSGATMVVITGGEPLLHDLDPLTEALQACNVSLHIETSGSSPFSGTFDWITLSPKKFKHPVPDVYPNVAELKVVVVNQKDFQWAEQHAAMCPESTQLYLQPEWETPKAMGWIVNYVKDHPHWNISLQTHKYLDVP